MRSLHDRVVVITGASRGLGAALAVGFASHGAKVALLARCREHLEQVADRARQVGSQAMAWPTDLTDGDAVQRTFESIIERWGRIDILVNAAGLKREGPIEATSYDDVMQTLQVNYLGVLACCQAAIPVMRRQGEGRIVNVSSILGRRATPIRGAYSASKAALNAMTDALRVELADSGIRVMLVLPGRFADGQADRSQLFAMTAEKAAARMIGCVQRCPRELVLTPAGRALSVLNLLAPGLVDRILLRWCRRDGRLVRSQAAGRQVPAGGGS